MIIKPRIYVAGALNADAVGFLKNCHRMMAAGNMLRKAGYSVFIPCLDLLLGLMDGNMDYDAYFENSQAWLEVSDGLFLTPGYEGSEGTKKEIDRALDLGIPVTLDLEKLRELVPIVEVN